MPAHSIYTPTQEITDFRNWLVTQNYDQKTVKSYSNSLLCQDKTKYRNIRQRAQVLFAIFKELSEPELIASEDTNQNLFSFIKQIIDSKLTFDQKMSLIRVLT